MNRPRFYITLRRDGHDETLTYLIESSTAQEAIEEVRAAYPLAWDAADEIIVTPLVFPVKKERS